MVKLPLRNTLLEWKENKSRKYTKIASPAELKRFNKR